MIGARGAVVTYEPPANVRLQGQARDDLVRKAIEYRRKTPALDNPWTGR